MAGVADASGQIVFTDVDPDFVGGVGDSFAIDFDGDGTDDVTIIQTNIFVRANASADGGVNGQTANGYQYAYNIASGAVVDSNLAFISGADLCYGPGYSNSFCFASPDGFIGVQFDISGATHFGWVALSAVDSNNFTVTEFAYEATPDTGIPVGEPLSIADNVIEGLSTYVSNDVLTIDARQPLESITINNLAGQEVLSQRLSNTTESVNLSALSTGLYIATVETEGTVQAIKFVK
jgi:hypothetical protein